MYIFFKPSNLSIERKLPGKYCEIHFLNKLSSKQEWYLSGACFHCTILGQMPRKMYVIWWPELYKNVVCKSWDAKAEENSAHHTASMRRPKENKAATKTREIPAVGIYPTKKADTKTGLDFPGFRMETKCHIWPCKDIFPVGCDSLRAFWCKQFGGCTERHQHLRSQNIQFSRSSSTWVVRICFSSIAGIILVLRSYSAFRDYYYKPWEQWEMMLSEL